MPKLAIIGLGLIGGSIGLALKRAQLAGLEVAGYDVDGGAASRARKLGAIDIDARTATEAVEGAAIVVIATPISRVASVMEEIAPALGNDAIVTDTASTKREVMRWARELLPAAVSFVGGHPIAGKEQSSIDAADAELFRDRPWAVVATPHASERAVKTVENLILAVGAKPVLIDAEEHDSYLAAVSHLPLLASTALFTLAQQSQAWPELAALAGPGFRDVTRLASTNPDLSHDISLTNRTNLVHWLARYIEELRRYRRLLEDEAAPEELAKAFATAQTERDAFLVAPPERVEASAELGDTASAGQRMLNLLVGEYLTRRTKDMEQLMERRAAGDDDPRRKREGR